MDPFATAFGGWIASTTARSALPGAPVVRDVDRVLGGRRRPGRRRAEALRTLPAPRRPLQVEDLPAVPRR